MWFCRAAGGGREDAGARRDPRGTRAPTGVRGKRKGGGGGGKKRKGLDNYSARFTVCKQLALPIRLSFMVSFGLFLVA